MKRVWFKKFLKSNEGASALEYVLIMTLVVVIAFAGIKLMGENFSSKYQQVSQSKHNT